MNKLKIYIVMSAVVLLCGGVIGIAHAIAKNGSSREKQVATNTVVADNKQEAPQYLNHKTKCFQCEKQMLSEVGDQGVWFAQPSKLYDAEQDGIAQAQNDLSGGYTGKTVMFYQAL